MHMGGSGMGVGQPPDGRSCRLKEAEHYSHGNGGCLNGGLAITRPPIGCLALVHPSWLL